MSYANRGSIRRRLLITLLSGVLLIWLFTVLFTASETHDEMQELLDAHLTQSASLLAAQVSHEVEEVEQDHVENLHKYAKDVIFQVWENGQELRLHSTNAPAERLSIRESGFDETSHGGRKWRVYSLWDAEHEYLIQVGEAVDAREHLELDVMERLILPLLLSIPLLGLLIWFAIGIALRPLDRIGMALSRRDPRYLEPIEDDVPQEITPLVQRLNDLLARVRDSLDNERRFTSDAAHELRTPLAAIKTQLQVAQGAAVEQQRQHAIAKAIAAGDRAAHLVEQLLTMARLEHNAWPGQLETVDLHGIAAQVLAETAPLAAEKHIRLALDGAAGMIVKGHAGLLGVLVRNLVDNAVRYSPAGSEVEIEVRAGENGTRLEVHDQGPGIPADERDNVLRRFHRLAGESVSGSGLGLSIVARIVELHQARLSLEARAGGSGLCVVVQFPEE